MALCPRHRVNHNLSTLGISHDYGGTSRIDGWFQGKSHLEMRTRGTPILQNLPGLEVEMAAAGSGAICDAWRSEACTGVASPILDTELLVFPHPSEKYEFVNWDDNRNPIFMGKCQIDGNHSPPTKWLDTVHSSWAGCWSWAGPGLTTGRFLQNPAPGGFFGLS